MVPTSVILYVRIEPGERFLFRLDERLRFDGENQT